MSNPRLRRARERAGLTQTELAERVGVSRQMVSSAEAGRHTPAVDTALRMAQALGEPVEELFGEARPAADSVLGGPLREGDPVVVGRVGSRLRAAPLASLVAGETAWAAPDGVVHGGEVRLFPGSHATGLLVVGCDPVLGLCDALLSRGGARRVVAVSGTTGSAVSALAAGRTHAAVVHGPEGALPDAPRATRRVHLARWSVGIGLPARRGTSSLEELIAGRVPLVQREESAASQQALLRAAGERTPPAAARASGHVDAARRAAIAGCAAVTFEPAARHHGLSFLPLESHVVELWIDDRWIDHPGARALLDLLGSAAFRDRVGLIAGYDLEGCGSLVRAA